jgi:mono/diheme cytochrome c family protein
MHRLAALLLGFAAMSSPAAAAPDGRAIADRWCAACHVVDAAQEAAVDGVPTFSALSALPPERLSTFVTDPHPPMPRLDLSRAEIGAVVGYIRSLAK